LTDELKARIEASLDKAELEDLYLPYKPKRRTKATIAREKGLEPLAAYLWAQQNSGQPLEAWQRHSSMRSWAWPHQMKLLRARATLLPNG